MAFKAAPLPGSFMIVSIIGFVISSVYTASGDFDLTWGITFMLVFGCMFTASLISMTKAPVEPQMRMDAKDRR